MKRRYECGYCGRRQTADRMVRSRHTGVRYCRFDQERCLAVGRKLRKQREAVA